MFLFLSNTLATQEDYSSFLLFPYFCSCYYSQLDLDRPLFLIRTLHSHIVYITSFQGMFTTLDPITVLIIALPFFFDICFCSNYSFVISKTLLFPLLLIFFTQWKRSAIQSVDHIQYVHLPLSLSYHCFLFFRISSATCVSVLDFCLDLTVKFFSYFL